MAISCSADCASGISRVKKVLMMTPICMMSLRLNRSDSAEAVKPPITTRKVGPATSQRISSPDNPSGPLASTIKDPPRARS